MKTFSMKHFLLCVGYVALGLFQPMPASAQQAGDGQSTVVAVQGASGQAATPTTKVSTTESTLDQKGTTDLGKGKSTPPPPKLDNRTVWPLVQLVLTLIVFGALGGFVDGLTTDLHHNLTWGKRIFDIGSLGDALVGATSALAIFTVANALFGGQIGQLGKFPYDVTISIQVIAIGVLSGYAGIRFLNPLTQRLAKQIAREEANEAVKTAKSRSDELVINVKDGDKYLTQYDVAEPNWHGKDLPVAEKAAAIKAAEELLAKAENSYKVALDVDATDTEALMGMAKKHRRSADIKAEKNEDASMEWKAAIKNLDTVIAKDSNAARAHYNRACYLALSTKGATEALKALDKAIEIYPSLKAKAKVDRDFLELYKNPEFIRICS